MASLTQNKKRVLFVNACVWPESRTERLARAVLDRLGGQVEELRLSGDDPVSYTHLAAEGEGGEIEIPPPSRLRT